ncbi:cytochrome P450 [Kitasatospora sp. CM 4170]|uniref:Cytochrome P450 n=1 Tax=Kitasatospora aburaviensis TaxID=67265 RepID=A0ABW1EUN0_9ACTN|nr:cytochrome P450 [Kitasatospora sp. CM 4170]WNM44669.1 cytochrome P450 [Kitasatospora sp. CM 4170]
MTDALTDTPPPAADPARPPAAAVGWSFPVPRAQPCDPPAEYRTEEGEPLRRVPLSYGGEAWLVTGYKQARAVLADHHGFSSDSTLPGYPAFPLSSKRTVPGHFLSMDPPQHTRLRQLVAAEFSGSRVRALRPALAASAEELIDRMTAAGGPQDLVSALAVPLPALSASQTLGTPLADRDFFLACTRDLQTHDATVAQRVLAAGKMNQYLEQLFTAKRTGTDQDLFSRLARSLDDGVLTMAELVGVANLIVVAGLETTAGLFSLTMLSLLADRRQGDLVREDPERWAGPAVAEALRYWTLVQHGVARVATRDVELGGRLIRAGDGVVVHLATANRDRSVFEEPDRFDLTRGVRSQLAFGHGIHRCLGSFLAQTQTELAVAVLMRRLPGLRLAEPQAEPAFLAEMLIYGLRNLNVTW